MILCSRINGTIDIRSIIYNRIHIHNCTHEKDTHTNTNTDANASTNTNTIANADTNTKTNPGTNADTNTTTNANTNAIANANTKRIRLPLLIRLDRSHDNNTTAIKFIATRMMRIITTTISITMIIIVLEYQPSSESY